ncbi:hypothetical protein DIPPA_16260, partial [Diplonema papillatum]
MGEACKVRDLRSLDAALLQEESEEIDEVESIVDEVDIDALSPPDFSQYLWQDEILEDITGMRGGKEACGQTAAAFPGVKRDDLDESSDTLGSTGGCLFPLPQACADTGSPPAALDLEPSHALRVQSSPHGRRGHAPPHAIQLPAILSPRVPEAKPARASTAGLLSPRVGDSPIPAGGAKTLAPLLPHARQATPANPLSSSLKKQPSDCRQPLRDNNKVSPKYVHRRLAPASSRGKSTATPSPAACGGAVSFREADALPAQKQKPAFGSTKGSSTTTAPPGPCNPGPAPQPLSGGRQPRAAAAPAAGSKPAAALTTFKSPLSAQSPP